jgi:hypothetical protein
MAANITYKENVYGWLKSIKGNINEPEALLKPIPEWHPCPGCVISNNAELDLMLALFHAAGVNNRAVKILGEKSGLIVHLFPAADSRFFRVYSDKSDRESMQKAVDKLVAVGLRRASVLAPLIPETVIWDWNADNLYARFKKFPERRHLVMPVGIGGGYGSHAGIMIFSRSPKENRVTLRVIDNQAVMSGTRDEHSMLKVESSAYNYETTIECFVSMLNTVSFRKTQPAWSEKTYTYVSLEAPSARVVLEKGPWSSGENLCYAGIPWDEKGDAVTRTGNLGGPCKIMSPLLVVLMIVAEVPRPGDAAELLAQAALEWEKDKGMPLDNKMDALVKLVYTISFNAQRAFDPSPTAICCQTRMQRPNPTGMDYLDVEVDMDGSASFRTYIDGKEVRVPVFSIEQMRDMQKVLRVTEGSGDLPQEVRTMMRQLKDKKRNDEPKLTKEISKQARIMEEEKGWLEANKWRKAELAKMLNGFEIDYVEKMKTVLQKHGLWPN